MLAANAGDPEQAAAAVDRCIERFGGVDILVNNAATNPYMGAAVDFKDILAAWRAEGSMVGLVKTPLGTRVA